MANKATSTTCTCHSCDNPYFVRAQIIAKVPVVLRIGSASVNNPRLKSWACGNTSL